MADIRYWLFCFMKGGPTPRGHYRKRVHPRQRRFGHSLHRNGLRRQKLRRNDFRRTIWFYLWLTYVCMDINDLNKLLQIQNMDIIYLCFYDKISRIELLRSFFTIVKFGRVWTCNIYQILGKYLPFLDIFSNLDSPFNVVVLVHKFNFNFWYV